MYVSIYCNNSQGFYLKYTNIKMGLTERGLKDRILHQEFKFNPNKNPIDDVKSE
jgi:hypothetical protein